MSSLGSRYWLVTWRRGAPFRSTVMQWIILAALTSSAVTGSFGSVLINLALILATAAWALIALQPGLRARPSVMAVFVAGVVAFSLALVIRDPWFGFYVYAGYTYSIVLLPWPRQLAGVAGTAIVAGMAQTWGVTWGNKGPVSLADVAACSAAIAANMAFACGLAWFFNRAETQFTERGRTLQELREANQRLEVALAENAGLQRQLLVQAREAGMLDERQRMAREIHDTLAQGLIGIVAQLQAAEHADGEPSEWRTHFAAATVLARESLSEARRSVDALRPEPLETAPLSEALAIVAGRWSARHGIPAWVTTTGTDRPLAPDAEAALLRTAQEALANVAKHAQATKVGVTLSYLEDEVALDVRDDGKGFDPVTGLASEPGPGLGPGLARAAGLGGGGGFGLVAMRQRIEGLAGTLQIESEPGAGTGISAHIPIGPAAATGPRG
jgi:signal transduction histidine kinase